MQINLLLFLFTQILFVALAQASSIANRVENLRKLLEINKFDAYIIPSEDAHLNEYISDHDKRREYISGFTGSAGTVYVTQKFAYLVTDGRYITQAKHSVRESKFTRKIKITPYFFTIAEFMIEDHE